MSEIESMIDVEVNQAMIEDQIYINADVESHELEEAITYFVNKNDTEVKEVVAQCK